MVMVVGRTLFYLCITIYLYGDLAIYSAAVAKSLRDVSCTYKPENATSLFNISDALPCWEGEELSRLNAYRYVKDHCHGDLGVMFCHWQYPEA